MIRPRRWRRPSRRWTLLRELSDEHVLRALMARDRMTRAELAACTGISKPTVGESVRRLVEAGVLADTGERTTGRGRVGSYYALAAEVGCALAVSIAPEGVAAEVRRRPGPGAGAGRGGGVSPGPAATGGERGPAGRPGGRGAGAVAGPAGHGAARPTRSTGRSGRLVHLPGAPFLVGELSPADLLAEVVRGPVVVDNDVNWAARAERDAVGTGPGRTSSTCTSARDSAARSSATARCAGAAAASRARSRM